MFFGLLKREIHSLNVKFNYKTKQDIAIKISNNFLDFVKQIGLESNGAVSHKSVNLNLSSNKKISASQIKSIKNWLKNYAEYIGEANLSKTKICEL